MIKTLNYVVQNVALRNSFRHFGNLVFNINIQHRFRTIIILEKLIKHMNFAKLDQ